VTVKNTGLFASPAGPFIRPPWALLGCSRSRPYFKLSWAFLGSSEDVPLNEPGLGSKFLFFFFFLTCPHKDREMGDSNL
jgi:hypothetical protein